jgi:hypothetical protein
MSEMITRVARAMAENAGFAWENCAQSQWESDARAGIKAMREPTKEMVVKAAEFGAGYPYPYVYRDMIDAALT